MEEQNINNTNKQQELNYSSLSSLKGLYVISNKEGRMLGKVTNVYVNTETKKLLGFFVKHDFWHKEGLYVPYGEIESFGEEIIQIKSLHWCEKVREDKITHGIPLNKLRGHRVTTQDGVYLGNFLDACFNSKDKGISELFISGGKSIEIDSEKIVIGSDEIIVPAVDSSQIHKRESKNVGLLSVLFDENKLDSVLHIFDYKSNKKSKVKPEDNIQH